MTAEDYIFPAFAAVGVGIVYWSATRSPTITTIASLAKHTLYERLFGEEEPEPPKRTMRPPPSGISPIYQKPSSKME